MPVPDIFLNAPELTPGLDLFMDAFYALSTDRALGPSGVGPIPWSAIRIYADECGIFGIQRDHLFATIREMDNAYIEFKLEEAKNAKPPAE